VVRPQVVDFDPEDLDVDERKRGDVRSLAEVEELVLVLAVRERELRLMAGDPALSATLPGFPGLQVARSSSTSSRS
jgi:hypothetical protein